MVLLNLCCPNLKSHNAPLCLSQSFGSVSRLIREMSWLPSLRCFIWFKIYHLKVSRWLPSWILERNGFSNSESPCNTDASHLVSVQSDMVQEMSFDGFQGDCHGIHLEYWNIKKLAILNPQIAQMPPTKFWSNVIWFRKISFEEF